MKKTACNNHTLRLDKLHLAVTVTIQSMIDTAIEMSQIVDKINHNPERKTESIHLQKALQVLEADREKAVRLQMDLYPDWKSGILTQQEYLNLKANISGKITSLDAKITKAKEALSSFAQNGTQCNEFLNTFTKYGKFKTLTRPMLIELVDRILVHEGGVIEVCFKFQDAFSQVAEYIELNRGSILNAN